METHTQSENSWQKRTMGIINICHKHIFSGKCLWTIRPRDLNWDNEFFSPPLLCNYKDKFPESQNWNFCKSLFLLQKCKQVLCHSENWMSILYTMAAISRRRTLVQLQLSCSWGSDPSSTTMGTLLNEGDHMSQFAWGNSSACWCPGLVINRAYFHSQIFHFWTIICLPYQ